MAKPIRPVAPPLALRSNPATFSARAEGNITYQFDTLPNWMDALGDFVDDRADDALAAALAGDLPPITGKAGQFLRVKSDETGAEFLSGANLSALAAVSTTGLLARTGAGTAAARTLTGTANVIAVTNGNGVSGNPTINAVKATTGDAGTGTGVGLMDATLTKAAIDAQVPALIPPAPPALQANSVVSRSLNVTYTNSLPRPVFIVATVAHTGTNTRSVDFRINYGSGLTTVMFVDSAGNSQTVCGTVPAGASWRIDTSTTNIVNTGTDVREFR